MGGVALKHVTKAYGGAAPAVRDLTLDVGEGEFFTLLGPSGCGKTTTLRMMAGLETPTEGEIRIGGRDCTFMHPRDRGIGLVFQSYALYPHMSVYDNIALNLRVAGVPASTIERRVSTVAMMLKLEHLLDRRPRHLSGGERQRVALGRALVRKPKVLLMDEPLSNLDLKLREHMRSELKRLHAESGQTMICVTHDQAEAMIMSDRIAVMQGGVFEQVGTPSEVYTRPANTFVATFVGTPSINLLSCCVGIGGGVPRLEIEGLPHVELDIRSVGSAEQGQDVSDGRRLLLGVRPEDVILCPEPQSNAFAVQVRLVEPTGPSKFLFLKACGMPGLSEQLVAMVDGQTAYAPGDRLLVRFRPGRCMLFDAASTALIGLA